MSLQDLTVELDSTQYSRIADGIDESAISIADMAERLTLFSGNLEGLGANTDRQVSMQNSVVDILMSIDESIFKLTSFLINDKKEEDKQGKFQAQEDAEKEKEDKGKLKAKPNKKDKKKEKESLMSLLGISALWRTLMATISAFALAFTTPILALKGALVRGLTIVSRLWIPVLAAIGFILGALEGWNETEGKDMTTRVTTAIMRGLGKAVEFLIGIPLDIIKSIVSWLAGAFGFTDLEKELDSFSFQDAIKVMMKDLEGWVLEVVFKIKEFFAGFMTGAMKAINKANRMVGGDNVFDLSDAGFETEATDQQSRLSADTNDRTLMDTAGPGGKTYTEAEIETAVADGTLDSKRADEMLATFKSRREGDADDIISEIENGVLDGQLSEKEAAYMMADVLREYPEADGMMDGTAFLRKESDLLKAAREVIKTGATTTENKSEERKERASGEDIPDLPPGAADVTGFTADGIPIVADNTVSDNAVATQSQQQSFGQDLGDGSSVMGTTGFANSEDEAIAKVAGDEARADNVRAFKRRQEARKQKVAEMSLDQLMSKVDRSPQSPLGKLAAVELERRKQEAIAGGTYKTETAQVLESTDMDMVPPQTPKAVGASGKLATEQDVNNAAKQQATMNVATGGATTNNSTTINGGGGGGDNAAPMSPRDNAEPARQLR
jgi:hypothetical protein